MMYAITKLNKIWEEDIQKDISLKNNVEKWTYLYLTVAIFIAKSSRRWQTNQYLIKQLNRSINQNFQKKACEVYITIEKGIGNNNNVQKNKQPK